MLQLHCVLFIQTATIAQMLCLDKDSKGRPLRFPSPEVEQHYKQACAALGKRWGVDGMMLR